MEPILEVKHLKKIFTDRGKKMIAVDDVSFHLNAGQCLGIVGESGSGKSTIARMIARLEPASGGEILFQNQNITTYSAKQMKTVYRHMQMIFQNPSESFNPRKTLGTSITEGMKNFGISKKEACQMTVKLLDRTGLDESYASRYPHQISGGQCQRAAIARALALRPDVLICDEATSALDVSVQQQILKLLNELQEEYHLSLLFISHDLALVQQLCRQVMVLYNGKIVEAGDTDSIIQNPQNPYTKQLLDSAAF